MYVKLSESFITRSHYFAASSLYSFILLRHHCTLHFTLHLPSIYDSRVWSSGGVVVECCRVALGSSIELWKRELDHCIATRSRLAHFKVRRVHKKCTSPQRRGNGNPQRGGRSPRWRARQMRKSVSTTNLLSPRAPRRAAARGARFAHRTEGGHVERLYANSGSPVANHGAQPAPLHSTRCSAHADIHTCVTSVTFEATRCADVSFSALGK